MIVLTKRPDDKHTRIIQKVRLLVDGQIVSFVNVHFSNNQYSDEQLEETLQYIRASGEASVILGDFNIFDITAVKHLYEKSYVASTEIADYISFPSEAATFDYVLVPKQYQLSSLETHEGLSDHNALTCKLAI
ncbi:Endonuclease/Exonuclease/phosphatase family protein [compost metagenome]